MSSVSTSASPLENPVGTAELFSVDQNLLASLASRSTLGSHFETQRAKFAAALQHQPFVTASHELWRYTKPEQFPFEKLLINSPMELAISCFEGGAAVAGFEVSRTADAEQDLLDELFGARGGSAADSAVVNLQSALVTSGLVVRIPKGLKVEKPLLLTQTIQASAHSSAVPLIIVEVGSGAEVTIVEDLELATDLFLAPRIEVIVRANARVRWVSLQRLSRQAHYLARYRFHCYRDCELRAFHAGLGAKVSRVDLDCVLYEPGAQAFLNSVYLTDGTRHADFHTEQQHLAPHCGSNLLCKGALKGRSRSVYYGFIRVAEGAQKTDAYQKNRNIMLSADAHADAIPNLEIKANDVRCSHGATVGQVSSEELFYLMSRGLRREVAETLLVEGFFDEVIAAIQQPEIESMVRACVLERLHA